jgi:hypothetical protein
MDVLTAASLEQAHGGTNRFAHLSAGKQPDWFHHFAVRAKFVGTACTKWSCAEHASKSPATNMHAAPARQRKRFSGDDTLSDRRTDHSNPRCRQGVVKQFAARYGQFKEPDCPGFQYHQGPISPDISSFSNCSQKITMVEDAGIRQAFIIAPDQLPGITILDLGWHDTFKPFTGSITISSGNITESSAMAIDLELGRGAANCLFFGACTAEPKQTTTAHAQKFSARGGPFFGVNRMWQVIRESTDGLWFQNKLPRAVFYF